MLSNIKDTVLVSSFLGGLFLGVVSLFSPAMMGDTAPTWAVKTCPPVVCDHDDLGASTGNFSGCVDYLVSNC